MALMVMGIGVVSVVTLFPLSLLRSVEATKLTNATLLRQNSQARIEASISYDAVGPPFAIGSPIPFGILQDPDHDGETAEHETERFVFDPLGAVILTGDGVASVLAPNTTIFGDIDGNGQFALPGDAFYTFDLDGDGAPDPTPIKRYSFGLNTVDAAEEFTTLPDSHITIFEGIAGSFTAAPGNNVVTLGQPILTEYSSQKLRVSAFDSGQRSSTVIWGTVTDATTITLDSPLPATWSVVDRVIVDIPERRYTWIATVRNSGSAPSVSVATFFRRSFSPLDEKAFTLTEPAGSYNVFELPIATNGITSDGLGGWTGLPPGFERGGWMFDLNSFRWWEIVDIQEIKSGGATIGFRFATDSEEYDSTFTGRTVQAIFPQNIIEVYTLKSQSVKKD